MTALARVAADLTTARAGIKDALAFVASVSNEDDAREAYDRIKLAKEWAKIRKLRDAVATDLLRLEIHCLRKIAQLGSLSILPQAFRGVADFYRDMTDARIEELIGAYGESASPTVVYRRHLRAQSYNNAFDKYSSTYDGYRPAEAASYDDALITAAAQFHSRDIAGALAAILDNWDEDGDEFTVSDLADELSDLVGIDETDAKWGARDGMLEVCRKAIRDAPTVVIPGSTAPKFITCHSRDREGPVSFVRVPFHSATLAQLLDMVTLRQEQARAAEASYRTIKTLADTLADTISDSDGSNAEHHLTLSELATRLAFAAPQPARIRAVDTGQTLRSAAYNRRRSA